jgi:hypothetical protein
VNENDLRDLLPDERSLASSRRRDMKERLMVKIQQEEKATRNHFRLIVGAAAASLIAVVGVAAVLAGNDDSKPPVISPASADRKTPDPDEVERATQGSGIDYGIDAEWMECFALDPPEGWGSETEEWHAAQLDPTVGTEPSLGSGSATPELMAGVCLQAYEGYVNAPAATIAHEVCVRDAVRPQIVVTLAEATCEDAGAANPGEGEVRPITDADVAEVNHMRAVEYALLAPMEECPAAEQVEAWVHQVLDEEDLDLEVTIDTEGIVEPPDNVETPARECPRFAHVDWQAGEVSIEPFRS